MYLQYLTLIVCFVLTALWHVMQLCERLLVDQCDRLSGLAGPLHRAVFHCVAAPSPTLRQKCRLILRRLVSSLVGTHTARQLLKEFYRYLGSVKLQVRNVRKVLVITNKLLILYNLAHKAIG